MWDPTAKRTPVVRELECSRDDDGVAQATITLTPWGTREALAFQDGAMAALKVSVAESGGTSVRRVIPSVLALLHLRLTVTDCSGFPDQDRAGVRVPFSFADAEHVLSLSSEVYDEIVQLATDVQPMKSAKVKKPQDRRPAGATGEPAEDFDDTPVGDGADPTPTRSPRASRPRR